MTVHNLPKGPVGSHGHGNAGSSTDSRTAVERNVSVKVPDDFTELLDSTPNGKWTVMDDGTPFIEQRLWIPEEPFLDGSGGLQCLEKEEVNGL